MNISFTRLTISHYLLLLLLIYIAFYFGLSAYPLSDNNEGLYAEIAREMLITGNYIIPHLNFLPYIEKPPLLYWLIASSYHLFGITPFAARLVPATCGVSVIACLLWFGYKIERKAEAWLTAIILTTSLGFIVIARIVFFDMLLTACFTFTLCLFYLWWQTHKNYYLYIAYIFLGCAVLCKGMVSLVLVPAITIIFLLMTGEKSRLLALFNPIGLSLFLAVILPWHIIASLKQPGFAWDYFINEQILRFLNERLPHDYYRGPIYYYLPRIFIYMFPWSLFFPLLLKKNKIANQATDKITIFLSLWVIVPLLFFSFSQAKANYYMVVSMPALAFLLAIKFNNLFIERKYGIFIGSFSMLIVIYSGLLIYLLVSKFATNDIIYQLTPLLKTGLWALFITATMMLMVSLSIYRYFTNNALSAVFPPHLKNSQKKINVLIHHILININLYLLAAVSILALLTLSLGYQVLLRTSDQYSEIKIANYLNAQTAHKSVYFYKNYAKQSSLAFYLQRRFPIINVYDPDLYYGLHSSEAIGWFINLMQFKKIAQYHLLYVALVSDNLADFTKNIAGIRFCLVKASDKVLLMSNDPIECQNKIPNEL